MRLFTYLLPCAAATALSEGAQLFSGQWKTLAPIPNAPRQEHSAVALSDTTIAIIGGIVPNLNGIEGFNTTSFVQFYDIPTDSWSEPVNAPLQVNHPNVAAVNGEVYLLGGLSPAPDGAWRAFRDAWKFTPSTQEWSLLPSLPHGKATGSATVGVVGNTIYLAGGMRTLEPIGVEGEQDTVDFVLAFDTESGEWASIPENAAVLPEGRDHAAGAVIGDRLYVLGGRIRGQYNVRDTVFALDTKNLAAGWITQKGRMPTPRGGVVGGVLDDKIFVFGGEGNTAEGSQGVFDNVEVYDAETDEWSVLPPMRLPRHGGAAVTVLGKIYLPGGGITEGGSPINVTDSFSASF